MPGITAPGSSMCNGWPTPSTSTSSDCGIHWRTRSLPSRATASLFPPVVAAGVEALVGHARDLAGVRERAAAAEDALGVIRVQADTLPFRLAERTGFVDDAARHAAQAEVVKQGGVAQDQPVRLANAAGRCRGFGL